MTKGTLTAALKKIGIKRATIYEEVGGFYIDIVCRPFPNLKEQDVIRAALIPAGLFVTFYRLKWNKNWFKKFQFVEVKPPHIPRHPKCRCVLIKETE